MTIIIICWGIFLAFLEINNDMAGAQTALIILNVWIAAFFIRFDLRKIAEE